MRETVPAALDGQRLDRVVAMVTGRSRAEAAALVDAGAVAVGGRAVTARSYRVSEGDMLDLPGAEPPAEVELVADPGVVVPVVHEDEHLLVVDKPAGVVVHPAPGHRGPTLASSLRGRAAGGPDPERAGIVHRLDRDTSGLLVVAKSEEAHAALRRLMRGRRITREYLALVGGHPATESGTIDAPIGRDRVRRTVVSTRTDRGRSAVTHFSVLERLPRTTLLSVRLEPGRTHQIRAHLAAIGTPVCGDRRYGGGACGRRLGLGRQFLHARKIMFRHPILWKNLACESKPPVDLRRALDAAKREPVSGGPDGD